MSFTIDSAANFTVPGFYLIITPWWLQSTYNFMLRIQISCPEGADVRHMTAGGAEPAIETSDLRTALAE